MQSNVSICKLSSAFFAAYPLSEYPELMQKDARPYMCLLVRSADYYLCVPFRSCIQHKFAYHFTGTVRSQKTKSGLDFKKTVVIKDASYIETNSVVVDNDEYTEMMVHIQRIVNDACAYVLDYINHIKGTKVLHEREFSRRYQYSTLPYFHDILGID